MTERPKPPENRRQPRKDHTQHAEGRPSDPRPRRKRPRKHDEVLKSFFAHPLAAQSLVRDFMARDWHRELDLDSIREVPTEHVSPGPPSPKLRRADAAWWVPFRHQRRAVVFHVEYQSAVAHDMLFRSLEYVAHLYRFLKDSEQWKNPDGSGAPAVLSAVLHVGPKPWRALTSVAALAPPGSASVARRQTAHLYEVLDSRSAAEQDLPADGTLLRWLVDLVRDWRSLGRVTEALAARYGGPEHAGVREGYAVWAEEAACAMGVAPATTPREGGGMSWQAAEAAEELRREGREQGLERGLERGLEQGREQGLAEKRALVVRQAERRFGSGTAERLRRILAASGSELVDEAADAVVDCETGDKLLARTGNGPA